MSKESSIFACYIKGVKVKEGTMLEISKHIGKSLSATYNYAKTVNRKNYHAFQIICIAEQVNIYEYKRDGRVIATGTMQEIAEQTGKSEKTIRWYNSASSVKRNMNHVKKIRTEERYYDSRNEVQNVSM